MFNTIYSAILRNAKEKRQLLVAIDGRAASGKTTLAAALKTVLSQDFHTAVIHTDDFYLPKESHDYEKLGGNMDFDRLLGLLEEVKRNGAATYRPFLCREQSLGEAVKVEDAEVILVEGSYSLHASLFPLYDLTFCLTVDPEEQKARIIKREGERAHTFFEKWIPLEEKHIADLKKRGISFLSL